MFDAFYSITERAKVIVLDRQIPKIDKTDSIQAARRTQMET